MWWIIGVIIAVIVAMTAVVIMKHIIDSNKLPNGTTVKIGRSIRENECIIGTFFNMNVTVCATENIKAGEAEICGHIGDFYLVRNPLKYEVKG